jgi:hypothetical protein
MVESVDREKNKKEKRDVEPQMVSPRYQVSQVVQGSTLPSKLAVYFTMDTMSLSKVP